MRVLSQKVGLLSRCCCCYRALRARKGSSSRCRKGTKVQLPKGHLSCWCQKAPSILERRGAAAEGGKRGFKGAFFRCPVQADTLLCTRE